MCVYLNTLKMNGAVEFFAQKLIILNLTNEIFYYPVNILLVDTQTYTYKTEQANERQRDDEIDETRKGWINA